MTATGEQLKKDRLGSAGWVIQVQCTKHKKKNQRHIRPVVPGFQILEI